MPVSTLPIVKTIDVENIYSVYYFAYAKDFRFKGESHPFYELVYCDTGEVIITDNDEEFTLESGFCFVHAPDHFHTIRSNGQVSNVFIISFDAAFKNSTSPPCFTGKKLVISKSEKAIIQTILHESEQSFLDSINGPWTIHFTQNPLAPAGYIQLIGNSLELLLIYLLRKSSHLGDEKNDKKSNNIQEYLVNNIISYLNTKIFEPISFTDIVQSFNYSPSYIKRIFKTVTGSGVMQYLSKLRIEEAKKMLSNPDNSLSHISDVLLFNSPQHFSAQFKKHTFMSPSAYRNAVYVSKLLLSTSKQ